MVELVDTLPWGGSVRKDVLVRLQSWAQKKTARNCGFLAFKHYLKNPQLFSQNTDIIEEDSKFYDKKLGWRLFNRKFV